MLLNKKYCFLIMLVASAGMFSSCSNDPTHPGYEYMPDMYRSASYETYSENPNFEDGMTARTPVTGTVPRGFMPFAYPNTNEGYEAAGRELQNPLPENEINLVEGERLYNIFCVYCHGDDGAGNGILISKGKFPPPPSFSGPLKDLPEGKAYFTVVYGKNLMGSHASQILPDDRWKILMFVKKLQLASPADGAGTAVNGTGTTTTAETDTTAQQN
jgi:mono/diheme cytochrome c family protein